MTFLSDKTLLLLWLVPILIGLYIYAYKQRKKTLLRFADPAQFSKLNAPINHRHRFYKASLIILTCVALIFALSRPSWGKRTQESVKQRGRDLIFMLDVSRSMLATDIKPNRLERAKIAIKDILPHLTGDRVALVVFAGDNTLLCPLTLDYGFFKLMLDDAGPHSVGKGGTLIGDALRMILADVIDEQDTKYKDIILITDGEDHESFPVEAAAEAGKRGIRLFAIGLGDEVEGQRVPINDERNQHSFVKHNGQEVWSKLNPTTLRQMANATPSGRYLNVATGAVDLGEVYKTLIASTEKTETGIDKMTVSEERFQLFIALAIFLLILEMLLSSNLLTTTQQ